MPDAPPPNDRDVMAAMQKLKAYSAYKARQSQTPITGGPSASDNDLQTVETWAKDSADSGGAWGEQKQQESNQKVREADAWKEQARRDDQEAAAEKDFRSKLDVNAAKEELKKKLDDHLTGLQTLADGGEPGFKGKLAATKKDTADAKKFIDENFEKSLDNAAKRGTEQRQERKAIAQAMEQRGAEGKKWQAEYGDQPGKFSAGQRADVQAALERINAAAGGMATEIQPFGASAAAHVERLQKIQAWVAKLKPQVDSQGPALKAAKALGASGAAEARSTFAGVEAFQAGLEGEAGDHLELFRRWTDENNRLAKQWANSPSEKHRQWARDWTSLQNS